MTLFRVIERKNRKHVGVFVSHQLAKEAVNRYEVEDIENGKYKPNTYEIVLDERLDDGLQMIIFGHEIRFEWVDLGVGGTNYFEVVDLDSGEFLTQVDDTMTWEQIEEEIREGLTVPSFESEEEE